MWVFVDDGIPCLWLVGFSTTLTGVLQRLAIRNAGVMGHFYFALTMLIQGATTLLLTDRTEGI